jgi:hypothetical protein
MARVSRWSVVLVLVLVALMFPVEATSAQTGLTFEAQRAELAADGTVVVLRGTYSCGPFPGGVPERGVIDLTVRQARPDEEVTGFGFFEPTVCNGKLRRFAASVTAVSGSFQRGPATWSASGFVEGTTGSQNVFVPDTLIRITR